MNIGAEMTRLRSPHYTSLRYRIPWASLLGRESLILQGCHTEPNDDRHTGEPYLLGLSL